MSDAGAAAGAADGKWMCEVCGFVYDEAEGWPDEGIAPGTRWDDLPDAWCCPQCRAERTHFEIWED